MRVLVACEYSGKVRDAFARKGHEAWSCDLLPTDSPGQHYQGDVMDIINDGWDLMIAHPPCTYLTIAAEWAYKKNKKKKLSPDKLYGRARLAAREDAIGFVLRLMNAPIHRICIENPIGVLSSRIRKPDQIIQPYNFGHDASKQTCLWLKKLPPLYRTEFIEPRIVDGKPRWGNQTDSGQNKLPPSKDRWKERSETYSGIACAMADQWSF